MDLEGLETGGHLQELEQAIKSKTYALMWVVQIEREVANDNQIARKLLDVVKDVDKCLKKRRGIIDELKVKKGMHAWKAITFYWEVEHCEMGMRQQLMLHINETQMRTFDKREFVEAMKKL
ncbi:hypothetical protein Tco_0347211 [Tanacetum coccineum]